MSDGTGIEWTDATWNPVTGCTKVSPGCDHCYAETFAERWRGTPGHHFEQGFDLTLRPERLEQPLRWKRPRRVFVNSMSDLFHDGVPDQFIAKVFAVMSMAEQHTFQLLTKRHARMRSVLRHPLFRVMVNAERLNRCVSVLPDSRRDDGTYAWPLPNVWLGVSVEDQQWADIRVPALLGTPAAVRWLSCEPLLGPVALGPALVGRCYPCRGTGFLLGSNMSSAQKSGPPACWHCNTEGTGPALDWIVVGGESGPGARRMDAQWARDIHDDCTAAGVPFFFKQTGTLLARDLGLRGKGHDLDALPADLRVREYPVVHVEAAS